MIRVKPCNLCKRELPVSNFYRDYTRSDGFKHRCKECVKLDNPQKRQYSKAYYEKNKETVKKKAIEKYKNDPSVKSYKLAWNSQRRAAIKGSTSQLITEELILKVYGKNCHICQDTIDLSAPRKPGSQGWERGLHIEHVVPISKGGENVIENMRPSHGICNLRKGASLN